jgi:hypothetical protein
VTVEELDEALADAAGRAEDGYGNAEIVLANTRCAHA